MFVGNIVQGIRIASAQGRELGPADDERVSSGLNRFLTICNWYFVLQLIYLAELLRLRKFLLNLCCTLVI